MAQPRSLYREVLKNFINSFKTKKKAELMGEDFNGTKYYETPLSATTKKKPPRWFEPPEKNNFEQEIPPEWQAWLAYRRQTPPTEEEIQFGILKMKKTLENSKKLEKPKSTSTNEEVRSLDKTPFPVLDDYEKEPGSK